MLRNGGSNFSRLLLLSSCQWTKTTRETVGAWTDASGDGGGLAALVYFSGTWYYTALVVPDPVTNQLLHREDAQINFLEMVAVVLFVETFVDVLSGNAVICFIHNSGVLGSLLIKR